LLIADVGASVAIRIKITLKITSATLPLGPDVELAADCRIFLRRQNEFAFWHRGPFVPISKRVLQFRPTKTKPGANAGAADVYCRSNAQVGKRAGDQERSRPGLRRLSPF